MSAIEDTDVLEVSTPELEDVVRIEDRYDWARDYRRDRGVHSPRSPEPIQVLEVHPGRRSRGILALAVASGAGGGQDEIYRAAWLWRFFAPCHEFLFRRVPKIFSQRSAEYFWMRDPGIVR